jgi:hypothetical protein
VPCSYGLSEMRNFLTKKGLKMKTFKKVFALCMLTMSAFLISCSKDSGSSSSNSSSYSYNSYGYCVRNSDGQQVDTTYCANNGNNGYYMGANGQCMNRSGQVVSYNYCQNQGGSNGQYRLSGNACYDTYTGQQVNYQLCTTNTGVNNGGGYAQVCYGYFYYQGQTVYCYGANCAGYPLISAQTGQTVRCQ